MHRVGVKPRPEATPSILRKLGQLEPDDELSHYKAMSLALRGYENPLPPACWRTSWRQPGFVGHTTSGPIKQWQNGAGKNLTSVSNRLVTTDRDVEANDTNLNKAFKELLVAAMLYRCGDPHGKAKAVLQQYTMDIHGHFARFAAQTLHQGAAPSQRKGLTATGKSLRRRPLAARQQSDRPTRGGSR